MSSLLMTALKHLLIRITATGKSLTSGLWFLGFEPGYQLTKQSSFIILRFMSFLLSSVFQNLLK
jgi:hypothetical protein